MKESSKRFSHSELHPKTALGKKPVSVQSYVENGLLFVKPYVDVMRASCKQRWIGLSVLDVYRKEFHEFAPEYYELAIGCGAINVNGTAISPNFKLRQNSTLFHHLHMHEPPVSAQPIKVVYEDEDVLVVDKPASLPVHPTGRYRYNTLVERLKTDRGLEFLGPCNRIDIPTSGVVILGKSAEASRRITAQMVDGQVEKWYYARVVGCFPPAENVECSLPLVAAGFKKCIQAVADHADALPLSKEAKTVFSRVHYDQKQNLSVVRCHPITGRAHQIRVHLQALGHPIHNDVLYNNPLWTETRDQMPHATMYEVAKAVAPNLADWAGDEGPDPAEDPQTPQFVEMQSAEGQKVLCWKCSYKQDAEKLRKRLPVIDLHSHTYRIANLGHCFETDPPAWAQIPDPERTQI